LRRDWRRRQEQCSDQREFLHVRDLVLVVLSPTRRSRTLAAIGPESMFHHDAAYEAALRALNTAAYVRPFVLYFN
jgi:hypothetical protein